MLGIRRWLAPGPTPFVREGFQPILPPTAPIDTPYPIFGYWDSSDHRPIALMKAQWSATFARFYVAGDADVFPLIEEQFPDRIDLYRRLRLPAARANIARLVLLVKHGGLYVDCDAGIADLDRLRALVGQLDDHDLVFVQRPHRPAPDWPYPPEALNFLNSILGARPGDAFLRKVCARAFENLEKHEALEQREGYRPYSIYDLCGTENLRRMAIDSARMRMAMTGEIAGRAVMVPEAQTGIRLGGFNYGFRDREHWSNRQRKERLFRRRLWSRGLKAG